MSSAMTCWQTSSKSKFLVQPLNSSPALTFQMSHPLHCSLCFEPAGKIPNRDEFTGAFVATRAPLLFSQFETQLVANHAGQGFFVGDKVCVMRWAFTSR